MVCKDTSKMYLKMVNGLISTLGLGVVAVAVYAIVEYPAELAAVNEYAGYAAIGLGAVLVLVGMLGCFAAGYQNKCLLFLYWIVMTLVTLGVMAVGVAFMLQIGVLEDVKVGNSQQLVSDGRDYINDFSLGVFSKCCAPYNDDVSVPECAEGVVGTCVSDTEFYTSLVSEVLPAELCASLEAVEINGFKAVGNTSCTNASIFLASWSLYLEENVTPIGITLIALSVILLLADVFTCCLICSNRIDYDKEYRERVQQQQVEGGAISGTNPSGVRYV